MSENKQRLNFFIDTEDWKFVKNVGKLLGVSGAEVIRRYIKAGKDENEVPVQFETDHFGAKTELLKKLKEKNISVRKAVMTGIDVLGIKTPQKKK